MARFSADVWREFERRWFAGARALDHDAASQAAVWVMEADGRALKSWSRVPLALPPRMNLIQVPRGGTECVCLLDLA